MIINNSLLQPQKWMLSIDNNLFYIIDGSYIVSQNNQEPSPIKDDITKNQVLILKCMHFYFSYKSLDQVKVVSMFCVPV